MKLMYLAQQTRPDLLYAVNVLAQYQKDPRDCDYAGALRILEYLRATYDLGLFYQKGQGDQYSSLPPTLTQTSNQTR